MTIISDDVGPVSALSRIATNYTTWAVDDVSYQNWSKVQLEKLFQTKVLAFSARGRPNSTSLCGKQNWKPQNKKKFKSTDNWRDLMGRSIGWLFEIDRRYYSGSRDSKNKYRNRRQDLLIGFLSKRKERHQPAVGSLSAGLGRFLLNCFF